MTKNDDNGSEKSGKDQEYSLWDLYTKDIKPLHPDKPKIVIKEPIQKKSVKISDQNTGSKQQELLSPIAKTEPSSGSSEIDKSTATKLKRGQLPIEARLDLHGLYQKQAKERLLRFILNSYDVGHRCVLVVTGKGKLIFEGEYVDERTPGVIRRNFKSWLKEPPYNHMILKIEKAQVRDGGDGAFYVLLRRKK